MKPLLLFFVGVTLLACQSGKPIVQTTAAEAALVPDGKLFTAAFQQHAAEYKALCFQAYRAAKSGLDEALKVPSPLPLAIVTDIDETILDNSPYAVHQALLGKDYDLSSWMEWTARAECDTLAGALAFFNYANEKGVEIFYISNREEGERNGTMKNLQRYGFPYTDNDHLILRQGTSSKEIRRQKIAATHRIVLFIGDNLPDFHTVYDKKGTAERNRETVKLAAEFGRSFIVLPNPNYGDWESAIYDYNHQVTGAEKGKRIKNSLKNY